MHEMPRTILARDDRGHGLATLIKAGPLLFTAGFDGHRDRATGRIAPALAGEAERQCDNAYGAIAECLDRAGASCASVVRLDHVTSGQDWLPRRQTVRGRMFGRPAPLASTGVAAKMAGINMLTAFAIAVADPADKRVLVQGGSFGMSNIASAVRGGPLLFVSGIRGTLDPRSGAARAEETDASFGEQVRTCYEIIDAILRDAGSGAEAIVRIDSYVRDIGRRSEDAALRAQVLGGVACASTVVGLPLGARGEVEITALALAPGIGKQVIAAHCDGLPDVVSGGGFVFVGECRGNVSVSTGEVDRSLVAQRAGQVERALSVLEAQLRRAGSDLTRVVRLELYLRDIHFAAQAQAIHARRFGDTPPVTAIIGAELDDLVEAKLNAIAI
jgi:enamine deaminase RidA (YjgF/YER057c/UK114 family)